MVDNKKIWIGALLVTVFLFLLTVYFFHRVKIVQTRTVLGTQVTVTMLAAQQRQGRQLIETVFREIERLEKIYSDRRVDSECYQLNQQPAGQWIRVSQEMAEIINLSFFWHRQSQGLFDTTVGRLGEVWGFKTDDPHLPTTEELEQARADVGMSWLDWDANQMRLRFKRMGVRLDLGGLAKLMILKKLDELMEKLDHDQYLINLGGDVLAGQRHWWRKWTIGLADPKTPTQQVMQVTVENSLVLSSGNYFRAFSDQQRRYHHIFDPQTGYPSTEVIAVTLIMPKDVNRPIPSLVVFLLGVNQGMALIEAHQQVEGLMFDQTRVITSSGWERYMSNSNYFNSKSKIKGR